MTFTEEKTTDFSFPNITVLKKFRDGQLCAYIAKADDGYAMYNKDTQSYEINGTDDKSEKVTRYYKKIICPLSYDFSNFSWEAVEKDNINEKYLF